MPRLAVTEPALRRALNSQSSYVCRTCLLHRTRALHTTPPSHADQPFWKRMQEGIFGPKDSQKASIKRDEATQKRFKEATEKGQVGKMQEWRDEKGNVWEMAPVIVPGATRNYVQASSAEGLERIGGEEWVRRKRDRGEVYVGFAPKSRMELTDQEWRNVLHHVAVEVLTLYQAGRDLDQVCYSRAVDLEQWIRTAGVMIAEKDGEVSLQFKSEDGQALVLNAIPQEDVELAAGEGAELEGEEISSDVTDSAVRDAQLDQEAKTTRKQLKRAIHGSAPQPYGEWLQLPLAEPALKLAILKRTTQLTGHRLADYVVSTSNSLSDLYHGLKAKPQPKKLAQSRQLQKLNVSAPNVTVYGKRRTPIDKEKDVGRWKVIEEELLQRGLPVTGSRWQGAKTTSPMA